MMNFIDISHWQGGLNLQQLFSLNKNLDGVIVKSSGGSSYVQQTCDPWVQTLQAMNKPWGFYHYMNDDGKNVSPEVEAGFWVKHTRGYFGKGVPFADYEDHWTMAQGTKYLKRFLDKVYEYTGIKPVVYCSRSVVNSQDFQAIAEAGYGLWVALYPNYNPTGFLDKPFWSGSVSPFSFYMMHQYSSTGRLNGYNGNLDLNKFYGDLNAWNAYAGRMTHGEPQMTVREPVEDKMMQVTASIIKDVFDGKYGIGQDRKVKLEQAGYDYESVQNKIDKIYEQAAAIKPIYNQATKEYWPLVCDIAENVL